MRKHQQRQILQLLGTIEEAQAAGMYADCQQGALIVGEFVESIKGEGTKTVAMLEEYCELVYQASNGGLGEKPEKTLRKQLVLIEHSIRTDLRPDRLEVVFMPYNQSMWDSLESVYLAAKADPQCDAYVMPIPHYILNEDETLGEIRYDGDTYPNDIPVTNWQDYDIEARHPDVIYTHYPYDDYGNNYTIHPNFYTKNLRQHCELVVHIPYFVTPNGRFDETFVELPGVIYADYVIVQSEEVRRFLIKKHDAYKKKHGLSDAFGIAKNKYVALGSPKFDKVINTKRGDCPLPPEWERLIGRCKKVIFYNTHMFIWIGDPEQYFKKMRRVFSMFRGREDIVMWWRPHPKIEDNFRIHCKEHLDEYLELVETYKREGWGIYDDTPDLHRAIAWADAYYGDPSSVTVLFRIAKKPVIVQDIKCAEDSIQLQFSRIAKDANGGFWGFDRRWDGLFKLDMETNKGRYAARSGCIPQYSQKGCLSSVQRYMQIVVSGDEVICFPSRADNIFVYNVKTGEKTHIPLDRSYILSLSVRTEAFQVGRVVQYDGVVYCFSSSCKAVIAFSVAERTVEYHTKIYETIGTTYHFYEETLVKVPYYISPCSDDGRVTILFRDCMRLISYSLPKQELEIITENPILSQGLVADFDGADYWLITGRYKKLVKWNPSTDKDEQYDITVDNAEIPDKMNALISLIDCRERLLIFPGFASNIISFDKKRNQFSCCSDLPVPEDDGCLISKYVGPSKIGNTVYIYATFNSTTFELGAETGKVREHKFELDNTGKKEFLGDFFESYYSIEAEGCVDVNYAVVPLDGCDINLRMDALASAMSKRPELREKIYGVHLSSTENADGTAGKAIYEQYKEILI